ncbi:MAG: class I SAM-dependent methyltransferase [Acidobacteria bacterium]|nr:class I SAM-dependent methyltransferase [Acidobacteriota bacterium]
MLGWESWSAKGIRSLNGAEQLRRFVDELERDRSLDDPKLIRERLEALDRLDGFRLDSPSPKGGLSREDAELQNRARILLTKLGAANSRFYETVRNAIRNRRGHGALLIWAAQLGSKGETALGAGADDFDRGERYDYLDEFVAGVFSFTEPATPTIALLSDMVAYQPTPARCVFDLTRRMKLTTRDVFVDLGSGLGYVALLVAVCTKARVIGIELEPSYVRCARQSALELKITNCRFIDQDVRNADLAAGTVFYLYTPFRGAILGDVLDRLQAQARKRKIRVCTFGPCTPIVASESWLVLNADESSYISVFHSRR